MFQLLPGPAPAPILRPRRAPRLVSKDGRCNIELAHGERLAFFLVDVWTAVVEIRWRFVLLLFVLAFTGSWFFFSLLWYWIARSNGDLEEQNRTGGHARCIENVHDLTTAFLYSLETQTTIGYGGRALTGHCGGTVALLVLQSLVGVFINCFMCGVVLAKLSLPKKRAKTVAFSDTAVICLKKGRLCLLLRVANLRKTLLIGSHIYGKLVRSCSTADGEALILDQVDVDFTVDAGKDNLFFVCPLTLYHVIDRTSPFYELSADTLPLQDFELVVFLDGTAESTSSTCQVRTSYTPQEVQWGHTFLPIISKTRTGKYSVDFSNFSRSVPVNTPHCAVCFTADVEQKISSCKHLHKHQKQGIDNPGFSDNNPGFSDNNPGFGDNNPGFSDNNPGFSDNNPGFGDNNPGFGDNNPGFSDNNPGFSDNNPGFSDNNPGFGDNNPGFGDNNPGFSDNNPGFSDNNPGFGDNNPGFSDNNPGFSDNNPGFSDNNPGFGDNNPGFGDNNPGFGDNNPGFGDNNPGFGDNNPGFSAAHVAAAHVAAAHVDAEPADITNM